MKAATITQLYPAQQLAHHQRKELALKAIQNKEPLSAIARQTQVSRKFLYAQKNKAVAAIESEFTKVHNTDVLFYLPVTKAWLMSLVLCLLLHCRSSMRGVQKLLIDAFDYSISIGGICALAQSTAVKAKTINEQQNLSAIKTATPDELFHQSKPVLAGVDTRSLYCYLLTKEDHRDADTWAIRVMDLQKQGFNPERFIADDASGLRLGHQFALPHTPCNGDIFHITKDMMDVRRFFRNQHKSAISNAILLDNKIQKAALRGHDSTYVDALFQAETHERQMNHLSTTIDTLVSWMQHDIFQLPGLESHARSELYDFIVTEFKVLEKNYPHRIRALRVSLENQKTSLLAFTHILDEKFHIIAKQL